MDDYGRIMGSLEVLSPEQLQQLRRELDGRLAGSISPPAESVRVGTDPDTPPAPGRAGSRRRSLAHDPFLLAAIVLGLSARMTLTEYGELYDVRAWRWAVAAIDRGNLYANTDAYNYGPAWGYVLVGLHRVCTAVAPDTPASLHIAVSLFLSLTDIIIFIILYRICDAEAALIYYLCPVTILLAGFYGQFYNLGLVPGLAAFALLRGGGRPGGGRVLAASALLGVSLAIKHFLVFYPLWLAFGPDVRRPWHRAALATVPYLIFLAGFAPFLGDTAAADAIRRNVFEFEAHGLGALLPRLLELFVPPRLLQGIYGALVGVPVFHGVKLAWAALMVLVGWQVMRRWPGESLFFYLAAMVALTPMMIEIYLVIPVAACAALRRFTAARVYLVISSVLLTLNFAWRAPSPDSVLSAINRLVPWRVDNPDMVAAQIWLLIVLAAALWRPRPTGQEESGEIGRGRREARQAHELRAAEQPGALDDGHLADREPGGDPPGDQFGAGEAGARLERDPRAGGSADQPGAAVGVPGRQTQEQPKEAIVATARQPAADPLRPGRSVALDDVGAIGDRQQGG